MADMKKFDPLFTFLEVYKKMDHDEKKFCQKMLDVFSDSAPTVLVQEKPTQPKPQKKKMKRSGKAIGSWIQSQCDICGWSFTKKCNNNKYCSKECRHIADERKGIRKHITWECVICGNTYYTKNKGVRTCSLPCRIKLTQQTKLQKNNTVVEQPKVRKSDDPYFKPKFIFDQN